MTKKFIIYTAFKCGCAVFTIMLGVIALMIVTAFLLTHLKWGNMATVTALAIETIGEFVIIGTFIDYYLDNQWEKRQND